MKYIAFILFLSFKSCYKYDNEKKQSNQESSIFDCTTIRDTIFSDGDFIKYLKIDSSLYDVGVKINNKTILLNHPFDCNTTNSSIPKFFKVDDSTIYLKSGSGFHYTEIFNCRFSNDTVQVNAYETSKVFSKAPNISVYKKYPDCKFINIHNWDTEHEKVLSIPIQFSMNKIRISKVFENYIIIEFTDGQNIKLTF